MKRIPQRVVKTRTLWKLSRQDRDDLRFAIESTIKMLDTCQSRIRLEELLWQLSEDISADKATALPPHAADFQVYTAGFAGQNGNVVLNIANLGTANGVLVSMRPDEAIHLGNMLIRHAEIGQTADSANAATAPQPAPT